MKRIYFFSLLAFGAISITMAQETSHVSCNSVAIENTFRGLDFAVDRNNSSIAVNRAQYQNTKGSPYLAATFQKSQLFIDDQLAGNYFMRYDAYSKTIEIKKTNLEEEKTQVLKRSENIKIVFGDKEIQYATFTDKNGKKQNDYLISVTKGNKYGLYERFKVDFRKGNTTNNSYASGASNRFTNSTEYYLKDNQSAVVNQIPTKKSKLISLFNSIDRVEVAGLIKSKSLKINKERDLITILDFADTIHTDYVVK